MTHGTLSKSRTSKPATECELVRKHHGELFIQKRRGKPWFALFQQHMQCGRESDTLNSLDSFVTLPLLLTWESVFFIPFATEVQSSSHAYNQQTHAENHDHYLLFGQRLKDVQPHDAAPGAGVSPHTLAVMLIEVHQQHALAVVQAVVIKGAVAALCHPLHHMMALFCLPCRQRAAVCLQSG